MLPSERGAVQIKVHSVPLRVQTGAAKRRDAQTRTDSHALTLLILEVRCRRKHNRVLTHARKHNRILLGPYTERDIK